MTKLRDVGFSPFVSPTRKGTHPHTLNGNYERDPKDQDNYEFVTDDEVDMARSQSRALRGTSGGGGAGRSWNGASVPSAPNVQMVQASKKGVIEWLFEHPILSLAGIAAGYIAFSKRDTPLLKRNPSEPDSDNDIYNDDDLLEYPPEVGSGFNGQNLTINVNCPPGGTGESVTTTVTGGLPPSVSPPSYKKVAPSGALIFSETTSIIAEAPKAPKEEKPKKHIRVTTQKQDPTTGKFLPAGSGKPIVQGASGAAAAAILKSRGVRVKVKDKSK